MVFSLGSVVMCMCSERLVFDDSGHLKIHVVLDFPSFYSMDFGEVQ